MMELLLTKDWGKEVMVGLLVTRIEETFIRDWRWKDEVGLLVTKDWGWKS